MRVFVVVVLLSLEICAASRHSQRRRRAVLLQNSVIDNAENFFAIDGCNTRGVNALDPVCMPRAALDRLAAVRCCSDTIPTTCESYCRADTPDVWDVDNAIADPNVTTWELARDLCEGLTPPMRLCTQEELAVTIDGTTIIESPCCETGCSGDDQLTWTTTLCDPIAQTLVGGVLTGNVIDRVALNNGVALVAGIPFWVFIIIGGVVLLIAVAITTYFVVKKRKTKRFYMEPKSEAL